MTAANVTAKSVGQAAQGGTDDRLAHLDKPAPTVVGVLKQKSRFGPQTWETEAL